MKITQSVRGPVYVLQWEDEETFFLSKKVLGQERELKALLKRMPEATLMFQVRHGQLQELVQLRIELENNLFQTASTIPSDSRMLGSNPAA